VVTEAGVVRSPGFLMMFTGTLAGWYLGSAKATVNGASGAGTETEQGVLQPGPSEVEASAPGGLEPDLNGRGRRFEHVPGHRGAATKTCCPQEARSR
jgi:hypothetical protein